MKHVSCNVSASDHYPCCFNALLFAYIQCLYCLFCSFKLSIFTESCGVCSVKTRVKIFPMRVARDLDRSTWQIRRCGVFTRASTGHRGTSCPSSHATPRTGPLRHSWISPGETISILLCHIDPCHSQSCCQATEDPTSPLGADLRAQCGD